MLTLIPWLTPSFPFFISLFFFSLFSYRTFSYIHRSRSYLSLNRILFCFHILHYFFVFSFLPILASLFLSWILSASNFHVCSTFYLLLCLYLPLLFLFISCIVVTILRTLPAYHLSFSFFPSSCFHLHMKMLFIETLNNHFSFSSSHFFLEFGLESLSLAVLSIRLQVHQCDFSEIFCLTFYSLFKNWTYSSLLPYLLRFSFPTTHSLPLPDLRRASIILSPYSFRPLHCLSLLMYLRMSFMYFTFITFYRSFCFFSFSFFFAEFCRLPFFRKKGYPLYVIFQFPSLPVQLSLAFPAIPVLPYPTI